MTLTPYFVPRPATKIDPPLYFTPPSRNFLSKTERLKRSQTGQSLLGDLRPWKQSAPSPQAGRSSTSTYNSQDRSFTRVISEPGQPKPIEYHLDVQHALSDTRALTRIFTPCKNRPCTEDDHYDTDCVLIRPKERRKVVSVPLPPLPEGTAGAAPTPSSASSPLLGSRIETATAPDLGPGSDVIADIDALVEQWTAQTAANYPPKSEPRTTDGVRARLARMIPSFSG